MGCGTSGTICRERGIFSVGHCSYHVHNAWSNRCSLEYFCFQGDTGVCVNMCVFVILFLCCSVLLFVNLIRFCALELPTEEL